MFVTLKPGERKYILGQALIRILSGRIAVMGKILGAEMSWHRVLSPPSSSLLYIECFGEGTSEMELVSVPNGLERLSLRGDANVLGLVHTPLL